MFSKNVKQFGIRHVLIGTVVVAIAMGLIATKWKVAVSLGTLILVGFTGGFFSLAMMFISDLIDDRRIDDRSKRSRIFNFAGLVILLATAVTVILMAMTILIQSAIWFLDRVP